MEQLNPEVEQKLEENLEYTAAKQLFAELSGLKNKIYSQGASMNGLLLIAVRRTANEILQRYQDRGIFIGEKIETKASNYSKSGSFVFNFSKKLKAFKNQFVKETIGKMQQKLAKEKEDEKSSV